MTDEEYLELQVRMSVQLFCGDCLVVLRDIPDNSVDAILCDMPYGTTQCKWDTPISFVRQDGPQVHRNRTRPDLL
jgi:hypothetical protein